MTPGRLGVLLAGLGAVATTFAAGVFAGRRGLAPLVGSLTEGARTAAGRPWADGLVGLDGLVLGAWDLHGRDALSVAREARVVPPALLDAVADELAALRPLPGLHDPRATPGLPAPHAFTAPAADAVARLADEIDRFRAAAAVDRVVVLWTGTTEAIEPPELAAPGAVDRALREGAPLPPSLCVALAAARAGAPFATAAPSGGVEQADVQATFEAAGAPLAGRDLKTGQTLLKATLAGLLRDRLLGVDGWFSLNLLGNADGRALQQPGSLLAKSRTKGRALDAILDAAAHPDLYGALQHEVRIEHYRPRGDDKEAWDAIDLFGWLGLPMQLKVDLLGRDSILAAPLLLDLARLLDLAARRGRAGPQPWLGFYFKDPLGAARADDHRPEVQRRRLDHAVAALLGAS